MAWLLRDCTRKIFNVIDYTQDLNIPALMYFSDTKKASDWVHWGFLKEVLKRMGFGNSFMLWIMQIYSSQEAEIWLEGYKLRKLQIHRQVRQGCLLSPSLFNVMIEMIAITVQQQKEIMGILTQFMEHKVLLYVDDAGFLLQEPKNSLEVLKVVLHGFGKVAGSKVNASKSIMNIYCFKKRD